MTQTVLVTGGAGFIGSNLIRALVARGQQHVERAVEAAGRAGEDAVRDLQSGADAPAVMASLRKSGGCCRTRPRVPLLETWRS